MLSLFVTLSAGQGLVPLDSGARLHVATSKNTLADGARVEQPEFPIPNFD